MLDRPSFSPESVSEAAPSGTAALLQANVMIGPPKIGARRFWTMAEIKRLQAAYPQGGINAALEVLPGRSAAAIYNQVHKLDMGKFSEAGPRRKRRVWTTTPQIDAAIAQTYLGAPGWGQVRHLAEMINRPQAWVSARARALGLLVPRFKEPNWCETELALLRAHGGKHPDTVRRLLAANGYKRTATAVVLMVKRLHVAREVDENLYTASALAQALGIDRGTVNRWIEQGWLKARKPKPREPGAKKAGSWAIHRRDIRAFIIDNVGVIDFRKLDKVWLVDLLASRAWED